MNSLKFRLAIVLPLAFSSLLAGAAEVYEGGLNARDDRQRDTYFTFTLNYEVGPDNTIKGTLKCHQVGHCYHGDRPIAGIVEGDKLNFETDVSEIQGCGKQVFRGVREGDNWAGTMNFQGARREITFKKR